MNNFEKVTTLIFRFLGVIITVCGIWSLLARLISFVINPYILSFDSTQINNTKDVSLLMQFLWAILDVSVIYIVLGIFIYKISERLGKSICRGL